MPIPGSGPLAISMFADTVELPLSAVSLGQQQLRDLAQKPTQDSRIAFSNFYGKGTYSDYVITIGNASPAPPIMQVNVGVISYGYIAADCPGFSPDPSAQVGAITDTVFKQTELLAVCIGDIALPPFDDAGFLVFKGAASPLLFQEAQFTRMDGTLLRTLIPAPNRTHVIAASGGNPAYTVFATLPTADAWVGYSGAFKLRIIW